MSNSEVFKRVRATAEAGLWNSDHYQGHAPGTLLITSFAVDYSGVDVTLTASPTGWRSLAALDVPPVEPVSFATQLEGANVTIKQPTRGNQ